MNIIAVYHINQGFIGLYASIDSPKSFSREFVDLVICNGEEGSCDIIAEKAGLSYNWYLRSIMEFFGWDRDHNLDFFDQSFSCYAFKKI